jgi:UDP-glucose 4-epimerase
MVEEIDEVPKKIAITGGAGFIGHHLATACAQLEGQPEVVVVDNFRSGKRSNWDRLAGFSNVRLAEGCITQAKWLQEVFQGVDWVFHLAAMVSVPESLLKPAECVDLNVVGTLNVLEAARLGGASKVVLSSSAAIYGDDPELPKHELMRPCPLTPYGVTKLDGEYYLEMFRREYGLSTVSLRYFNVFGPHQDPASQYAAAVPIFATRALANQSITIFGDGLQTRDFVFVEDVVAANLWVAERPELSGVFNVATGQTVTILDLAQSIKQATGSTSELIFADPRPGDIRASWSDPAKLFATGFRPRYNLAEGLRKTLASYSL